MSFITDGSRSTKRLNQGKKLLAQIKEIGIPSKVTEIGGFRYKVSQQNDKIMIDAPMGLAIIRATPDKITVSSSEYWLGSLSPLRDFYVNSKATTNTAIEAIISAPDTEANIYAASLNSFTDYGTVTPSVMPYYDSEGVVFRTSMNFASVSQDEHSLTSFDSDGSHTNRISLVNVVYDPYANHRFLTQYLGNNRYLKSYTGRAHYTIDTTNRYLFSTIAIVEGRFREAHISSDQVWLGKLPVAIYNAIHQDTSGVYILGTYGYTITIRGNINLVQAIDCSAALNTEIDRLTDLGQSVAAIQADYDWSLFYTVVNGETGQTTLIKSSAFLDLLNEKSTGPLGSGLSFDYLQAAKLVRQFFPYPNISTDYFSEYQQPHDGIMFHCPTGVYSWTRKYGAFHFNTATLTQVSLSLPTAASSEGVRPTITYAGNDYYLCVCEDVSNKVVSIHTGSPFIGWGEALPLPTSHNNDKLVYVRPVYVTTERVILVGIAEIFDEVEKVVKYHAVSLDRAGAVGAWIILSEIKATTIDGAVATPIEISSWDITLYGKGVYVSMLNNYPSPPPVTGNKVFKAYSEYTQP